MKVVVKPLPPIFLHGAPYCMAPSVDRGTGESATVYTVIDRERMVVLTTPYEHVANVVAQLMNDEPMLCGVYHRNDLYRLASERWGSYGQLLMLHEEIGELLVAVGHYHRERATKADVVSEIADVRVMLEQLVVMIGASEAEVYAEFRKKLARLADRLSPVTAIPKDGGGP